MPVIHLTRVRSAASEIIAKRRLAKRAHSDRPLACNATLGNRTLVHNARAPADALTQISLHEGDMQSSNAASAPPPEVINSVAFEHSFGLLARRDGR